MLGVRELAEHAFQYLHLQLDVSWCEMSNSANLVNLAPGFWTVDNPVFLKGHYPDVPTKSEFPFGFSTLLFILSIFKMKTRDKEKRRHNAGRSNKNTLRFIQRVRVLKFKNPWTVCICMVCFISSTILEVHLITPPPLRLAGVNRN